MLLFDSSLRGYFAVIFGVEMQFFRALFLEIWLGKAVFPIVIFGNLDLKNTFPVVIFGTFEWKNNNSGQFYENSIPKFSLQKFSDLEQVVLFWRESVDVGHF